MLTFFGKKQRFCDGLSRRNFLQIGAFGAGLTLADMLRLRANATTATGGATATSHKAAIMIYLPGGPSHMDMYDLKPDAPSEYRGEFHPIATNVPGVQICEHFPLQAQMWDRLACIRSIISVDEHSDSLVMTGYSENNNRTAHHPSFGSVVSRLTNGGSSVPPFISLRGLTVGCEPGYLGVAHRAFQPSGPGLDNLNWPSGVGTSQVAERQDLLAAFDDLHRDIDASGTMEGMDAFTTRAFDMVTSGAVRQALDLSLEAPQSRARFAGIEPFLQARRLVEAGVGCVTLAYGGWDTHGNNFMTLRQQLPNLDRGVANLVQDLCDRGMDEDVSVVVWGEFGRTPRVNGSAGRDHWAPVMSAMVAGGGMHMGQAVGASSPRGEHPAERPVSAQRVLASLYRAMGIDPGQTFLDGTGRPRYICEDREPITELIG
jgi:hypothetical protein